MKTYRRLLAWYRNWRNPVRMTLAEAQAVQNAAYRRMIDNASGLPPVMHGEAGFVPVSYYDGKVCTETEIGSVHQLHRDNSKCPDCLADWAYHTGTGQTLLGYCSPKGHKHDDNCRSRTYVCASGHKHRFSIRNKCDAEGCDWIGKAECFCHPGAKLAEWPEAPMASVEVAMREILERK